MNQTSNINTEAMGAERALKPRRTRNLAVAFAAALAVAAAAPAASLAANGVVDASGSGTNISGDQSFGTTTSGAGTTIKKSFYVYTTDRTLTASDRTTNFSINGGTEGNFAKVGSVISSAGSATCSYSTNTSNQTFSVRVRTAGANGTGRRECKFDVEFKLNQNGGDYSESMSTSGTNIISGLNLKATVTAEPAAAIWNSDNTAAESSRSYADTIFGANSSNYAFTLKNTGNVTLSTASTQALSGTNSSDFSIVSTTCGATLARNATCTVTTKFNPSSAGAKAATFTWTPS
ncbi:MAG: choice-of-anchor D domain-containing protein, partial [Ilumatobacteraceae bacterium]